MTRQKQFTGDLDFIAAALRAGYPERDCRLRPAGSGSHPRGPLLKR